MPKNADFLQKKADFSKTKETLVLKNIFYKTNEFQTGNNSPPTSKQTPKNPTQIRFKEHFNNYGYNFGDISKINYSRSFILK